jgi:iron complex outermembrane recepter protein
MSIGKSKKQTFLASILAMLIMPVVAQNTLEEIIVTAQKRAQSADDVAITLTAISGRDIEKLGLTDAPDIVLVTPGVNMSGSFAGQAATFAIRGVTQQDFAMVSEAPVALYMDEGYYAANNAAGVGLFDLERVEILKGPQGTLFGRNATGGLVSITSRKPTEEVEGRFNVGYGSYDNTRVEGAVGGKIADNVQARIAGVYETQDGWVENINASGGDLGGHDTYGVRLHIAAQPSENVDVLLSTSYLDRDQSWGPYLTYPTRYALDSDGIPNSIDTGLPDVDAGFISNPRGNVDDLVVDSNQAQDDGSYFRVFGATANIGINMGWANITSITDYRRTTALLFLDNDAGPNDTVTTFNTSEVETISQELRLYKEMERARFSTGFYYLNIDTKYNPTAQLFAFGGVQAVSPTVLETDSYSLFGQVEYDISDKVSLVGGIRATREEKDYSYDTDFFDIATGAFLFPARSIRDKKEDWLYTWKLQAEYRPNDDSLFYIGYNRGTKAGSFNVPFAGGAAPVDADVPYDDEKLDAFEVGTKLTLYDNRAQLNASVFYYDYSDYQSFSFVNFGSIVDNLNANTIGAEIDLNIRPTEDSEIKVGLAYTDAEVENVNITNPVGSATLDRRAPFNSKWSLFALARKSFPFATGQLSIQGDIQYNSDFYFSVTNYSSTLSEAHTVLGARVSWMTSDEHWEIAFFGKNLTDERHQTVGFDASNLGWTQAGYNKPRWFGGSINYRF